ncbi:MAG: rRNA maturation RNase YbeY [Phycisphaerales bacterium]|nr:rRNA maturation RNase YbeY [Phycisphaerales bacterium]
MSVRLMITNRTRAAIRTRWLARQLRQLLALQKVTGGSWSITVVADKTMRALHKRTMNDSTSTDVLTFDMQDNSKNKNQINLDTILCRDVAAANAREYHHSLDHELLLYALHSLLHVQGYDDRTSADSARMHRREDALLIRLGVGPIYKPRGIG